VHQDVSPQDNVATATAKVLDRAARGLVTARDSVDHAAIALPADVLAGARRVEFYGQGNSGIVAQDAQHKFFRLGIATAAYSDPHVHAMSAATLTGRDVVVAISASGRSMDLIRSVEIAKGAGVTVIALTTRGSPLMRLAEIAIATDIEEDPDLYAPMVSRLVHLALIDALAVLVALRQGSKAQTTLDRGKRSLREKRSAS
jgi:RpiR family carbohydrate utilization transcriptional regulator